MVNMLVLVVDDLDQLVSSYVDPEEQDGVLQVAKPGMLSTSPTMFGETSIVWKQLKQDRVNQQQKYQFSFPWEFINITETI